MPVLFQKRLDALGSGPDIPSFGHIRPCEVGKEDCFKGSGQSYRCGAYRGTISSFIAPRKQCTRYTHFLAGTGCRKSTAAPTRSRARQLAFLPQLVNNVHRDVISCGCYNSKGIITPHRFNTSPPGDRTYWVPVSRTLSIGLRVIHLLSGRQWNNALQL